jgi:hypothetical protein
MAPRRSVAYLAVKIRGREGGAETTGGGGEGGGEGGGGGGYMEEGEGDSGARGVGGGFGVVSSAQESEGQVAGFEGGKQDVADLEAETEVVITGNESRESESRGRECEGREIGEGEIGGRESGGEERRVEAGAGAVKAEQDAVVAKASVGSRQKGTRVCNTAWFLKECHCWFECAHSQKYSLYVLYTVNVPGH